MENAVQNPHVTAIGSMVANFEEERVSNALFWQCDKCGYSAGVQGPMPNGIIFIDSTNDFYIVNWRVFDNEIFVKEVPVIYHVKRALIAEAIKYAGRWSKRIPQSELGCCGKIKLFAPGQSVNPRTIHYHVNEIRVCQAK